MLFVDNYLPLFSTKIIHPLEKKHRLNLHKTITTKIMAIKKILNLNSMTKFQARQNSKDTNFMTSLGVNDNFFFSNVISNCHHYLPSISTIIIYHHYLPPFTNSLDTSYFPATKTKENATLVSFIL